MIEFSGGDAQRRRRRRRLSIHPPSSPLVDKSTSPQELTGLLFLSSQESRILYSKSRQFPPFFSMFERKKLFR